MCVCARAHTYLHTYIITVSNFNIRVIMQYSTYVLLSISDGTKSRNKSRTFFKKPHAVKLSLYCLKEK